LSNLAEGKPATQSSLDWGGDPARAVDGNTDGNYASNSVTHTAPGSQPWWQVDLGQLRGIQALQIFNRTDCCAERLSDFYVFVSATDMGGQTLAQLMADPNVTRLHVDTLGGAPSVALPLVVQGRFVRVQLAGANFLSLAEVQVFGP
jgi:alpha-L-fucosidase 2